MRATQKLWPVSRWLFYAIAVLLGALMLSLWILPAQLPSRVGCAGSIAMFGVECAGFAGAELAEWSFNIAMFVLVFLPVLGADCFMGGEACDYFGPWIGAAGVFALVAYFFAALTPLRWSWQWVLRRRA